MPKKVIILIDSLGSGGAQNRVVLLAKGLKKLNFDVSVFYYYNQNFFKDAIISSRINEMLIPKSGKIGVRFIYNLRKEVIKGEFDVIISFLNTPNFYNILIGKLIRKRLKHVICYGSKSDLLKLNFANRFILKWVNKSADTITCNSYHENEYWVKNQKAVINKIFTIYNGVDPVRFYPQKDRKVRKNKILIVGSISPMKNGMLILQALKKLKHFGELNFTVTWIGRIDKNISTRSSYARNMLKFISEHELDKHINLIDPQNNILEYFHDHDALLHASLIEGLPNVVCESLATGTPVLISNVLDHPRMVEHKTEGLLFDPTSSDNLVSMLTQFYGMSNDNYLKMQDAAIAKASLLFSYEKFINEFAEIVENR